MSGFALAKEIQSFFYFIIIYTYLVNFGDKLVFRLEPPFKEEVRKTIDSTLISLFKWSMDIFNINNNNMITLPDRLDLK